MNKNSCAQWNCRIHFSWNARHGTKHSNNSGKCYCTCLTERFSVFKEAFVLSNVRYFKRESEELAALEKRYAVLSAFWTKIQSVVWFEIHRICTVPPFEAAAVRTVSMLCGWIICEEAGSSCMLVCLRSATLALHTHRWRQFSSSPPKTVQTATRVLLDLLNPTS